MQTPAAHLVRAEALLLEAADELAAAARLLALEGRVGAVADVQRRRVALVEIAGGRPRRRRGAAVSLGL